MHLWVKNPVHLDVDGVWVTTPEIDDEGAVIEVAAEVKNTTAHTVTVRVTSEVRDANGGFVVSGSVPASLRPHTKALARQRMYVVDPALWSLESPNLYTASRP